MAAAQEKSELDSKLNKLVNDGEEVEETVEEDASAPMYRVMTEEKIAVSKKTGTLWKSRKQAGYAKIKSGGELTRWDEAYRYYRNDHHDENDPQNTDETGRETGSRLTTRGKETENIVFANTTSLVPAVYAKNPTIEISADNKDFDDFAVVAKRLINAIMRMKSAPGVNLKPKARRAVINCILTNEAWMEVGYIHKEQSNDEAMVELQKLSTELVNAKNPKQIKEVEGKLEALESRIDLLSPSAPVVKFRAPYDVIVDPDASMTDECRWMMYRDYVSTDMLRALYGQKNEKGEYDSVFHPSHVLKLDDENTGGDDADNGFSFLKTNADKTYKDYGFEDDESYKRAQRTEVWYVWDKVTRRVYLFNNSDWKWPLWVWEDPYQYPDFYPLVRMNFYDDPTGFYARSETMMYLDQQDAINQINNEVAKVRDYISGKVIYNKNILKDEKVVDEFVQGTTSKKVLGIDVPADVDLTKLFAPFVPQSTQSLNTIVFDKARLLEAIDRVSSVTSVMRGVEYKTNTTNKAIESYESTTQTKLDEKIDAVEDTIGVIGEKLLHVCLRFMDDKTVESILGPADAEIWGQFRQAFIDQGVKFTATVTGGSTLKPTSGTKKQQAVQLTQALGQFASAAPVAIIVALKVMERAFDEVVIRKEDWDMIIQSVEMQMMKGQNVPQGGGEAAAPSGGEGEGDIATKIEQMIDGLPDEAKMFLGKMIAEGTPIREAVGQVVQELQSQTEQTVQ